MFFRNFSQFISEHTPKRILIVQLGDVASVVQTLPLLITLRTRFATTEIAWLAEENCTALLNGHWALDRLMIVRKNWNRSFGGIRLLRRRLKLFAPELTIDTQSVFASSLAAWLSGASYRLGFDGEEGKEGSRWFNNCRVLPSATHAIDRNMQLLEKLEIYGSSIDFDLPECEMDRRSAIHILHQHGLHGNFAVFPMGAAPDSALNRAERASEPFPAENCAEVVKYLSEQWNLPSLILWDNEEDRKAAENVVQNAKGVAVRVPKMPLSETLALIRRATLLVGQNSGPLQMAAAVGTRCVGIFDSKSAQRGRPYGHENLCLESPQIKMTNGKSSEKAIPVDQICDACDRILTAILPAESLPLPMHGMSGKRVA